MLLCRIVNEGDKPFTSKWEGNVFTIRPGSEIMVTQDAANRWTGNPTTVNDGKVNARREEYNRLRVLYGAYENDEKWEANHPRLAVYDLDGNRINTVIDDPEGTALTPAPIDRTARSMQDQMEDMQRQMDAMARAMADQEASAATGVGSTEGRPSSIGPEPEPEPAREPALVGAGSDSIRSQGQPGSGTEPQPPQPQPGPVPASPPQQVTEDTPQRTPVGGPATPPPKPGGTTTVVGTPPKPQ